MYSTMIIMTEIHSSIDLMILKCAVVRLLIYLTTWIRLVVVFLDKCIQRRTKNKIIKEHTHTNLNLQKKGLRRKELVTLVFKYLKT